MNKIKLIIIDLDDTIYSEYDFIQSGFQALASDIMFYCHHDRTFLVKKMNEYYLEDKKRVFNNLISFLNIEKIYSVSKCIETYKFHKPIIKPYQDFFSFYKKISLNKINLVLLTDGTIQQQKNKVIGLGIKDYFKSIYYSDYYGIDYRKPNPEIYNRIIKDFKVSVDEVIVIGDNPNKDFFCRKTLGICSIQIIRPNAIYANEIAYLDDIKPERVIHSLDEITLI
jgi:putative hydrolase of the HAD superfamily